MVDLEVKFSVGHLHVGRGKEKEERDKYILRAGTVELWKNERNLSETEKGNLRFSRSISSTSQKRLSVPSALQESLDKGKLPRLLALTLPVKPSQKAKMLGKGRSMVTSMLQEVFRYVL